MSIPDPDSTAPTADAPPGTADAPPAAPAPPPRTARDRLAAAITYLAVPLMVLALLDPLEGGILIALLAIPVAFVAFMRHSRARWLIVLGLLLFAAAFAYMSVAGQVAAILQNASLLPWMAAVLVTVAGGLWLLRDVLADRHPRAARVVPAVLVLVTIVLTARVAVLLGDYRPWDVPMTERATIDGPGVRLRIEAEDRPLTPRGAIWAAAVLENRGAEPVAYPPGTVLNVVLRDEAGTVAWDGVRNYYGPVPRTMPWEGTGSIAPGASSRQAWAIGCESPGVYRLTAEVMGGPFDGLATEPVTVTCAAQP